MRVFVFLVLFSPLWSWASNVQDAFDSGLFGQVVQDLRKSYKADKLTVDEVFLLAESYRELGQLRYARDVLINSILSKDDIFKCKSSLSTEQCIDGFVLLSEIYTELGKIGKNGCSIRVSHQAQQDNELVAKNYLDTAELMLSEQNSLNLELKVLLAKINNVKVLDERIIEYKKIKGQFESSNDIDVQLLVKLYLNLMKDYSKANVRDSLLVLSKDSLNNLQKRSLPPYQKYQNLMVMASLLSPTNTSMKELFDENYNNPINTSLYSPSKGDTDCSIFAVDGFDENLNPTIGTNREEAFYACESLVRALNVTTDIKPYREELTLPILSHFSMLFAKKGYYEYAINLLRIAISKAQITKETRTKYQPENLFYWNWQLGHILMKKIQYMEGSQHILISQKKGIYKQTKSVYESAIQQLDYVERNYLFMDTSFLNDIEEFYLGYTDFLKKYIELFPENKKQEDTNTNQSKPIYGSSTKLLLNAIESYKFSRLKSYYKINCPKSVERQKGAFKDFEDFLVSSSNGDNTAIIYYWVSEDKENSFVSLMLKSNVDEPIIRPININKSDLKKLVEDFRKNIEANTYIERIKSGGHILYRYLLEPIEQDISKNIKTLVIIPTSTLNELPFSALYDGNHYLIQKYRLAMSLGSKFTPSDNNSSKPEEFVALLSGLSKEVNGYDRIKINISTVLQNLSKVFADNSILEDNIEGRSFTINTLSKMLQQPPDNKSYNVIHFLTHGKFENDEASLLTYDSVPNAKIKLTLNELKNILRTAFSNENKTLELVTFGACQTALGNDKAALGLAGTSVQTGAKSSIATLWNVDQESTVLLMQDFYKRLLDKDSNESRASALQKAQISILKEYKPSPHYWAGFILVGSWL